MDCSEITLMMENQLDLWSNSRWRRNNGEWIYYLINGDVDKYYLDNGKLTRMDRHSAEKVQK